MSGSLLLDLLLGLVLLVYTLSGFRQGLIAAMLGLLGLIVGAFVTLRYGPSLIEEHTDLDLTTPGGTLVLIGAVLVVATVAQGVMLAIASRFREAIRAAAFRAVDSTLGAVALLVAAILVTWVVAGAVRTGGPPPLRAAVAQSAVIRFIDFLVPSKTSVLVDDVTRALDRTGIPRVFEGLGPEPITPVTAPDPALVKDPQVARAVASVIHVRAEAPRCDQTQVGSGWVLSSGKVVTNAHVVAGASRVTVDVGGKGPELVARVVAFDADRDIAVLAVPSLPARPIPTGTPLARGADTVLAGFPGDEGLWVGAGRVRGVLEARGANIYGDTGTTRQIYSLRAQVRQGASGGPVLDTDGRVVGMVFATSLDDPQTGYALTLAEMTPVLRDAASAQDRVGTGRCTTH